jgi:uncharacterized protein (DUF433 family)
LSLGPDKITFHGSFGLAHERVLLNDVALPIERRQPIWALGRGCVSGEKRRVYSIINQLDLVEIGFNCVQVVLEPFQHDVFPLVLLEDSPDVTDAVIEAESVLQPNKEVSIIVGLSIVDCFRVVRGAIESGVDVNKSDGQVKLAERGSY